MTTRAAIYLRQSLDRTGEELAVERQRQDCQRIARERGWSIVGEYVDNSVSASSRTKARPAYDRLVSDFEAGKFGALVCWDLDRLTRQPRQLEDWIDAAEDRGLVLLTANGEADLSTDNGRLFARIKASVARAEVERKSARQRRANEQRAEAGKPHAGRRAFGYSPDGANVNAAEAEQFRYAVDRLLAGGSLRAIARELTERGAKTTAGNPWKPTELRRLLVNPRHAGMRVHRGDVIGTGTWPAIIDEDTHRAVSAILADPARRKAGRPRRYLLTALATCGVCGAIVYGVTERRGPLYYCQTRTHVARKAEPIDELVSAVIVARLSLPDARETLAHGEDKARVRALQTEARGVRVKLDGLAEAFAVGDIDRAQLRAGSARLTARAGTIETELGRLVGSGQLRDLASADDLAAAWGALDIDGQRAVIGLLCEVRIYPAGQGARAFDPETVQVEWRA